MLPGFCKCAWCTREDNIVRERKSIISARDLDRWAQIASNQQYYGPGATQLKGWAAKYPALPKEPQMKTFTVLTTMEGGSLTAHTLKAENVDAAIKEVLRRFPNDSVIAASGGRFPGGGGIFDQCLKTIVQTQVPVEPVPVAIPMETVFSLNGHATRATLGR